MITCYVLNTQFGKVLYATGLSSATYTIGGFLSDCDSYEDENSNRLFQSNRIAENLFTFISIQNTSFLKIQSYPLWQPPKNR